MKNIEIKTTQNVMLQYELADLRDRVIAFILDALCMLVSLWFLAMFGFSLFTSETGVIVYSIFLYGIFFFYSLAFETLNNGRSIGKMAMGIQVIKTTGGQATFSDYAARWVFRVVDIYLSLGGIASILITSSSKSQRIGDIVANTAVIRRTPKVDLTLQDILTIHSKDSYKPVYTQAKQLMEQDVLLIKSALDRYRKFKNEAHGEALKLLADRIKEVLDVKHTDHNTIQFLQTVLNDYVVLTR